MTAATTEDHRQHGFWAGAQRQANTVFLFFINPVLDDDSKRLSGTKLMAWVIVWVDIFDVIESHRLGELALTKGAVDAIDLHNVELFALAFLMWFGKPGLQTAVDLVKAWRGKETG